MTGSVRFVLSGLGGKRGVCFAERVSVCIIVLVF